MVPTPAVTPPVTAAASAALPPRLPNSLAAPFRALPVVAAPCTISPRFLFFSVCPSLPLSLATVSRVSLDLAALLPDLPIVATTPEVLGPSMALSPLLPALAALPLLAALPALLAALAAFLAFSTTLVPAMMASALSSTSFSGLKPALLVMTAAPRPWATICDFESPCATFLVVPLTSPPPTCSSSAPGAGALSPAAAAGESELELPPRCL